MRTFQLLNAIFVAFLCLSSPVAEAQKSSGQSGVGFIIGAPTAITGKFHLDQKHAIDVGFAFGWYDYFLVYGDYLLHYPALLGKNNQFVARLSPYLGVGGIFAVTTIDQGHDNGFRGRRNGSFGLGLRVPFGAEWRAPDPPIGIFVEIVPAISVVPQTTGIFQAGIGIRYYF